MINELQSAFKEIAELRALPQEVVLEALQSALVSAYRRDASASSAQAVEARVDPTTGRARIFVEKEVVEQIEFPKTEVTLEDARYYNPEAQIGDTVMVQVENTTKKFGRIAAQTAKQVILQKIREAERKALYDEFVTRQGDLVTGTVQSVNHNRVTLSLGRAEADLPRSQQIPGERYKPHDKLRVYLYEVNESTRGPQIIVSRSHRNMLRRLLEYEVPEIYNGQVEIKSIAREAGYRSKVAVAALQEGIDPVGACVGMRGIRIQNIVKELHEEKIDVIEWSADAQVFIAKALSPARVTGVYLEEDLYEGRTAVVLVPEDQLSLAIGREGQNARLAAKLTGWRIDIKSVAETVESALENLDLPPLDELAVKHARLIEEVRGVMAKRAQKLTVTQEEFNLMGRFADLVELRLLQQREELRQEEQERLGSIKETLPEALFQLPLDVLALDEDTLAALEPLGNVGEVMLATLADEERLQALVADLEGSPLEDIQSALDVLMESDMDFDALLAEIYETEEPEAAAQDVDEAIAEPAIEEPPAEVPAEEVEAPAAQVEAEVEAEYALEDEEEEEEEPVLLDAFGGRLIEEAEEEEKEEEAAEVAAESEAAEEIDFEQMLVDYDLDDSDELFDDSGKPKKKKGKGKRRQLVFDEDSGEVVAKRRRKTNRKRNAWDEAEF